MQVIETSSQCKSHSKHNKAILSLVFQIFTVQLTVINTVVMLILMHKHFTTCIPSCHINSS